LCCWFSVGCRLSATQAKTTTGGLLAYYIPVIPLMYWISAGSVRGLPGRIRIDNGPEMLAQVVTDWCEDNGIELAYIQPGKPNQNAYIERFNRSFFDELLDPYLFTTMS